MGSDSLFYILLVISGIPTEAVFQVSLLSQWVGGWVMWVGKLKIKTNSAQLELGLSLIIIQSGKVVTLFHVFLANQWIG
jgi:hypothetical protein